MDARPQFRSQKTRKKTEYYEERGDGALPEKKG